MATILLNRPLFATPAARALFNAYTQVTPQSNVALNVAEDAEGYMVEAFLPGFNPSDIEITLEKQVLTIRGERQAAAPAEGVRYHLRERNTGRFERSLRFPTLLNNDAVHADYSNGVLTIRLPKAEAIKPRRIEVKSQAVQSIEVTQ